MSMNCHQAKRYSTSYLDGRLRSDQRSEVAAHLSDCESCSSYFDQVVLIRSALRGLSPVTVPQYLQTRLKVIASKQRAETLWTRGSRFQAIWERWKFRMSEMMRPVALPATGGLLSSIVLFGTFILMIGTTTRIANYEIPLIAAAVEPNLVPLDLRSRTVILNMTFDSSGRIADYQVGDPSGNFTAGLQTHPASITVPDFSTVFAVALPVSGDIQIKFQPIAFRQ